MTIRNKYSKEFKLDAIAQSNEQAYSPGEAAKNLGVNPILFSIWMKKAEKMTVSLSEVVAN